MSTQPRLLFDVLRERAAAKPDTLVYEFAPDGVTGTDTLTYGRLYAGACRIAADLAARVPRGAPVLLLYPSSLDYVTAFFGCLAAGVVATPACPPERGSVRSMDRLRHMMRHAGTDTVLTNRTTAAAVALDGLCDGGVSIVATDALTAQSTPSDAPDLPSGAALEDVAFLQYTSGSTGAPKGVAVRHGNLWHNLVLCQTFMPEGPDPKAVTWLPAYHDMGLIEGLLRPVFGGYPTRVIPPEAFLRDPMCWLRAIADFGAVTSGGPNFAYDLCVRRARHLDLTGLDLSAWRLAYNSAEPVRAETLEAFVRTFAPCGFDAAALNPGYGLAEHTLVVSGHKKGVPYRVLHVDPRALGRDVVVPVPRDNDCVRLVSCGEPVAPTRVRIADPATGNTVASDGVGEVLVQGPCVAAGYHRDAEQSAATFVADSGETWLRTGDLGFVHEGLLYLAGRRKDVIIVGGVKHYPGDVEATAAAAHAALRKGRLVCFGVRRGGSESLVILAELRKNAGQTPGLAEAVRRAVRSAIAVEHGVDLCDVMLVMPDALLKTTSGKPCRASCRAAWLQNKLPRWQVSAQDDAAPAARVLAFLTAGARGEAPAGAPGHPIEDATADLAGSTLGACGLGSLARVELCLALTEALGREVPPHALCGEATLAQIARQLYDGTRATPQAQVAKQMVRDADFGVSTVMASMQFAPSAPATAAAGGRVLMSGGTGFVGHHVVLELLRAGWRQVVCLSRNPWARAALLDKMAALPGWDPHMADRVAVAVGDVTRARWGCAEYDALARGTDAVIHAAANVRWTDDYPSCRVAHVEGTRQLLSFALHGRVKPFVYVSSLAALHWVDRVGADIDESTDSFAHRDALDWGYGQGKSVAEQLVACAQAGGLPARVVRPALVWGHGETGVANPDDILAAMIRGCIRMRAAPDMDWHLDACAPDVLARAIAALCPLPGAAGGGLANPDFAPERLHVAPAQGRHFRELILWLDLHGYPMRLVPYDRWCALLQSNADADTQALRSLLPLFTRPVGGTDLPLPQWYTTRRRPRQNHARSAAWLAARGIVMPALDDTYVARVIAAYVAQGVLPPTPRAPQRNSAARPPHAREEDLLREAVHNVHPDARIDRVAPFAGSITDSIMLENTAVSHGDAASLRPYRLYGAFVDAFGKEYASVDVMFKRKPHADAMAEVVRRIAALANPETGVRMAQGMAQLDVPDCHRREIGVYALLHEGRARHVPALWGSLEDPARRAWVVVMGYAVERSGPALPWGAGVLPLAVQALAHLHAPWLRRDAVLSAHAPLGARRACADKVAMLPLWEALREHLTAAFPDYLPGASKALAGQVLDWLMPRWHRLDALPQTLIHNDFSPRNSFVVEGAAGPELCVYDWELAKIGAAQQDLVSFLCLMPESASAAESNAAMETHRTALARASGVPLDEGQWLDGMRLALADFLVDRLAMYAMLHRVRPTDILPQALRNWWRLADRVGLTFKSASSSALSC